MKNNVVAIDIPTKTKPKQTAEQRFKKLVAKADANGCELYTGPQFQNGYGRFSDGENISAHRYAWKMHYKAEIPEGMYILHAVECTSRLCTAKSHLRCGTAQQNSLDMVAAGRSTKGRTIPKKPLTADDKAKIAQMLMAGSSQYKIAKALSRSEQVISFHCRHNQSALAAKLRARALNISVAAAALSEAIGSILDQSDEAKAA